MHMFSSTGATAAIFCLFKTETTSPTHIIDLQATKGFTVLISFVQFMQVKVSIPCLCLR